MESHASATGRRVLIVLDEEISGGLRDEVIRRAGRDSELFVVAPALVSSALKHEMGDIDDAIAPARERLERSLRELREAGASVAGEVGDADPVMAINDEIQKVGPDEILLVTHAEGRRAYAEKGVFERVSRDFPQPVTEIVVGAGDGAGAVADVHSGPPVAERDVEGTSGYGIPIMSRQDLFALLGGLLGTAILIGLAIDCMLAADGGEIGAGCIARMLIAGGAILINLAHVVGLLLFQSVKYRGVWERFMARLTLVGTLIAIPISVLVG